jgi:hypothetical protein
MTSLQKYKINNLYYYLILLIIIITANILQFILFY